MTVRAAEFCSPRKPRAGFTLIEIVLAVAVIATVLIALIGVLPAGMKASRDATEATLVAVMFEDINQRLRNQVLKVGVPDFSPVFFDNQGTYISIPAEGKERADALAIALFRADVEILDWKDRPQGTSSLLPVRVSLSWPLNPTTGTPLGPENPKTEVTYAVTALTGPDWPAIYPPGRADLRYVEKIEF